MRGDADWPMRDATDEELLVAARRDPDAFGVLYDRWVGRVTGFFFRRTACPHTAADLTAETFAAAFEHRRRFDANKGRFDAWIYGVARNQLGHYVRSESVDRRARERLGIADIELDDDSAEAIVNRADAQGLFEVVRAALASLSTPVRDAIELRVAHDLPYDEVASRLGCSEGAARVRVARGLAQLHDLVGAQP